jgi:hypothetical protein
MRGRRDEYEIEDGYSWYRYRFPSSPCTLLVVTKAGCTFSKDHGGTGSAYLVIRDGADQLLDKSVIGTA